MQNVYEMESLENRRLYSVDLIGVYRGVVDARKFSFLPSAFQVKEPFTIRVTSQSGDQFSGVMRIVHVGRFNFTGTVNGSDFLINTTGTATGSLLGTIHTGNALRGTFTETFNNQSFFGAFRTGPNGQDLQITGSSSGSSGSTSTPSSTPIVINPNGTITGGNGVVIGAGSPGTTLFSSGTGAGFGQGLLINNNGTISTFPTNGITQISTGTGGSGVSTSVFNATGLTSSDFNLANNNSSLFSNNTNTSTGLGNTFSISNFSNGLASSMNSGLANSSSFTSGTTSPNFSNSSFTTNSNFGTTSPFSVQTISF